MESCMKPIAKAMMSVLGVLVATTTACAAPGERLRRAEIMPEVERQRTIAATTNGFVIRTAGSIPAGNGAAPVTALEHIPVGSGTHFDARLLSRPASPIQEIPNARP